MTTDFARPEHQEPTRDRWGRPLVTPPEGGAPVAYTRMSTISKTLDDTTNLSKWMQRTVAHGIGQRPDLATLARTLDPASDKSKLNDLCQQAMAAAQSGKAANLGTALHTFAEWADSPGFDMGAIPVEYQGHVANYITARDSLRLTSVAAERFVVCDELKVAGSFDRLYHHPDLGLVIGDLKTGSSAADFPHATAAQIAGYAHSMLYDVEAGTRTAIPGLNLEVGVLVHWDQATGICRVYQIDIRRGWDAIQLAAQVHQWRKEKSLTKEMTA